MSIRAHLNGQGTRILCGAKGCSQTLAYVQTLTHTGAEVIELDPWSERWGGAGEVHFPLAEFAIIITIDGYEPRELQPGESVRWVRLRVRMGAG